MHLCRPWRSVLRKDRKFAPNLIVPHNVIIIKPGTRPAKGGWNPNALDPHYSHNRLMWHGHEHFPGFQPVTDHITQSLLGTAYRVGPVSVGDLKEFAVVAHLDNVLG